MSQKKILFVCLGNICRSPAAQAVMQSIVDANSMTDQFIIDSAGTYGGHTGELPDSRMRVHARRRGYELTHHSRKLQSWDFDEFDLIIGMDDYNISKIKRIAPSPEAETKVRKMTDYCRLHPYYDSVPDPYYEGAEGFELVLDLLEDACQNLFNELKNFEN